MSEETRERRWIPAIGVVGTLTAGLFGFVGAFYAFFSRDFTGFGVCLLASAMAFGLLTYALVKE
jgi:hypothetical protein